jgi:hypothetical protein
MMNRMSRLLAAAATLLVLLGTSSRAHACSASETQVYASKTTVWCVDNGIIAQYGTFPSAFFTYGDNVIKELVMLFDVPAAGVYTFEAGPQTGGAHTGSECCGLGVTVSGDAFYGNAYNVTGFWGYLLSLHETINDWTGQVSGGWPTDFWADHVSAFPNSMDWRIMAALGTEDNDANLTAASKAQKARFYPGGDSVDPRVPMFDTIFDLPNMGFTGYSRIFSYVQKDGMNWDSVANNGANPDVRRTEYVIAYLSLGAGKSVLATMQAANVANGMPDGAGDPGYAAQEADIDGVANAHCAIAAAAAQGANESSDQSAFKAGNYAGVKAAGSCGTGCPSECGCKKSTNRCVAPWLGDVVAVADGGTAGGADLGTGGGGPVLADAGVPLGDGGAPPVVVPSGCSCQLGGAAGAQSVAGGLLLGFVVLFGRARLRRRRA